MGFNMAVRHLFTNVNDRFLVNRIDDKVVEFRDFKSEVEYRYDITNTDNISVNKFTNCRSGESHEYGIARVGLSEPVREFCDNLFNYLRDDMGNLKSYRFEMSWFEPTQCARIKVQSELQARLASEDAYTPLVIRVKPYKENDYRYNASFSDYSGIMVTARGNNLTDILRQNSRIDMRDIEYIVANVDNYCKFLEL